MAGTYIPGMGMVTYLDEIDISCALNTNDVTIDRSVVDARTFCGNAQVPGEKTTAYSFGGFGYFGAGEYEEQLDARLKSGAHVRMLTIFGNAAAARYYEVVGPLTSDKITASPTELIGLAGEVPKGDTFNRGLALHVNQTFTADGAQTGQNVGAVAATETFVFVVRCKSVGGAGSFVVKPYESSTGDGGDPYAAVTTMTVTAGGLCVAGADLATFTGAGWAVFVKTGAVEAWRQLVISSWATLTGAVLTVTTGTQMPG
jgi:hypothetical protein